MDIKYCDFCPVQTTCTKKEHGDECVIPVKILFVENRKMKYTLEQIRKEVYKKKSYESKIIAINQLLKGNEKC